MGRAFKMVYLNSHALFKAEIIRKSENKVESFKTFFPRTNFSVVFKYLFSDIW